MAAEFPAAIASFGFTADAGDVLPKDVVQQLMDEIVAIQTLYLAMLGVGPIAPPQITSNQNDYNPTGLSTASLLRLTSDASRTITGIVAQTSRMHLVVYNGGAQDIVLAHNSGSSSAANRILNAGAADVTLNGGDSVELFYDNTSTIWRTIGR